MSLVICPKCGEKVSDIDGECFICGAKLQKMPAASVKKAPSRQPKPPVVNETPKQVVSDVAPIDEPKDAPKYKNSAVPWVVLFTIMGGITLFYLPLGIITVPTTLLAVVIYCERYFKGEHFASLKQGISDYITDCNELDAHIANLRNTYASLRKTDYGEATFQNISRHNYSKKKLANAVSKPNIYDCSRTVCDNARKQPFKYICKYFNIKTDEKTLSEFEQVLNNFIAAEEGKQLLKSKREEILANSRNDIPWVVREFYKKRLDKELGFNEYQFNVMYFPTYSFRYVSAGGNSGSQFDVTFDIPMLERFIGYLGDVVKFKKSAAGQRRLMTPKLRAYIINRDNSTCRNCGNSTMNEPNLLLEVDHIVPIAKGGITSEENLQCLCWKCNRTKGAKVG